MNNLTEVVKQLIIINVIIFVAMQLPFTGALRDYFVMYPWGSSQFKPIQIISHMFSHANTSHLFFNMLGLFFFGPWIERSWGPKKFLVFYIICGLGAALSHILIGGGAPVLGASGAISGVLVAFAMMFPNVQVMLLFPPIPMKAKYMVLGYLAIDLFQGMGNYNTGIAHFAHLGGALTGFLLILYWRKYPFRF